MLSTKHVVLGLVIERQGYGYDLQQRMNSRFGFLGLSDRAVYKCLDRLKEEGLIAPTGVKEAGKTERGAARVIYAATEGGIDEFTRWLAEPCEISTVREQVHVKLVLAQAQNWPIVIELTERLEQACLTELRSLQERGQPSIEELIDSAMPWDATAAFLVDDAEITRLQGTIDWLQRTRWVVRHKLDPTIRQSRTRSPS